MSMNGGWITYPDRVPVAIFARAGEVKTKPAVIKSGQVIKALSFLESDADGKLIAYTGFTESAQVTYGFLTSGQTQIIAGLTFTSGASGTTAAQLATAWGSIDVGDTASVATTKIAAVGITSAMGTFTSGTLANWETEPVPGSTTKVNFRSTVPGTNPTDLAATGTGSAATISTIAGETTRSLISGLAVYDVDATSADVPAAVYIEGSFWADALVWAVDVATDTITNAAGTGTIAVTAYRTGAEGTSAASNLLKSKFVEGSEIYIDFKKTGEVY